MGLDYHYFRAYLLALYPRTTSRAELRSFLEAYPRSSYECIWDATLRQWLEQVDLADESDVFVEDDSDGDHVFEGVIPAAPASASRLLRGGSGLRSSASHIGLTFARLHLLSKITC